MALQRDKTKRVFHDQYIINEGDKNVIKQFFVKDRFSRDKKLESACCSARWEQKNKGYQKLICKNQYRYIRGNISASNGEELLSAPFLISTVLIVEQHKKNTKILRFNIESSKYYHSVVFQL